MNKFEMNYCKKIATLNLLFVDEFSKDFVDKVAYPIADIIFDYMKENEPKFGKFLKEVFSDETI